MAIFHGAKLNLLVGKSFKDICVQHERYASAKTLRDIVTEKIPVEQKRVKEFVKKYAKTKIGEINVEMIYRGNRGMLSLLCETSLVYPDEGICIRGNTIKDCQAKLPKAEGGNEPLPEGMFWLLMTGDIPTQDQVRQLTCDWNHRGELPKYVIQMLKGLPKDLHPMSQFSAGIIALNKDSKLARGNRLGVHKLDLWQCCFEDSMDLIAKLPVLASHIYINTYRDGKGDIGIDKSLDWTANFCKNLGFTDDGFTELMRLYLTIHSDHEGGNVSAHTTHLVGSALSDPYLSFAAGMNGLAGPLHGLANQEVLVWIEKMQKEFGNEPTEEQIKEFCLKTLKTGVIPGFGHAVLRKTDPRYTCLQEYALKNMPNDPLVQLTNKIYKVVPPILKSLGKVQNPWPNVDAYSGVLLQYYGMKEVNFYTVLFGISRALGVLASLVWDRALLLPIERPKSTTTEYLQYLVGDTKY